MTPVYHARRTFRLAASLGVLLAAPLAQAAMYCVRNETELQTALSAAAASPADDEIKLRVGVYTVFSQPFTYNSQNAGWLWLTGGWLSVDGTDCAARSMDAARTVLSGAGQHPVLRLSFQPSGPVANGPRIGVQNLSIRDGYGDSALFQRGGGVQMFSSADAYTELWLSNTIVAGNQGYFGGGADLYAKNGLVRIDNSLFMDNQAPTSAYGHVGITVVATEAPHGVIIANSTFVNGQCAGNGTRGCGVGAGIGGGVRMDVVNSLFRDNALSDLTLEGFGLIGFGDGSAFADYSLIGSVSGNLALNTNHALAGDPRFVDAPNRDFRLRDDSPFINQGLAAVPLYPLAGADLDGNQRNRFGATDPGAYENQSWDFLFGNGFD